MFVISFYFYYPVERFRCNGVEHAEAIIEVRFVVAVDLPCECQRHLQPVVHVVCRRAMRQITCKTYFPVYYKVLCTSISVENRVQVNPAKQAQAEALKGIRHP